MMIWNAKHPRATFDHLGMIPKFVRDDDPRSAREQFDANYAYGGGWHQRGFSFNPHNNSLLYPGDPPLPVLFETRLRDETIRVYECSWVAIVQSDGSFEIARMD